MAGDLPNSADDPFGPVVHLASTTVFAGPLPPPQWLAEYDRVHPGLAGRLIDQVEVEAAHRRALVEQQWMADSRHTGRGQWMAFGLSAASLGLAGWLAATAGPWAATPFALTALTPVAAAFLKQRTGDETPRR